MKNIVVVSSTPRNNGNSDVLANEFVRGAKEAGHNVTKVDIRKMSLNFCKGCFYCRTHGECVIKDDVNALLSVVQNADVLVFATPIYYYEMSGQLKTFLDRLNPLYDKENKFTDVYCIMTAADDDPSAMDKAIGGVQGWIDCFDGVSLKECISAVGLEGTGEAKTSKYFEQAYEMGKRV